MAVEATDLKIAVEKPATWARRLTITVPADRVAEERRSAVQWLSKSMRLPGFRKGKIPASVMEKRFGKAIEQETLERLMGEAYREAIKQEGLQPITQGSIDKVEYDTGSDLVFDVAFDVRPEVELNRIGGFTVNRQAPQIDDAQVDQVIDRLRSEHAQWSPIEGEVVLTGDMAIVEITPIEDGKAESAAIPRTYQIVLGEGQALPAIEEAIRTLQPGQEEDFTVDLPEDAADPNSPLSPHRLHVKVKEAKRPALPAADDEFAKSLGDFESLTVLRDRIATDLQNEAASEAESSVRSQLIGSIVEANPFDVPDSMVSQYIASMVPEREGLDAERLQEIRESARPAAERGIRRMLVVDRVAELESLHATSDEVESRVADIAARVGRSPGELRAQLASNGRLGEIEQEITESKVFDYLKSLSTIE
jgi:trigger factor